MRKILAGTMILLLVLSGCKKTEEITVTKEPGIRFASASEIEERGGYAINQADFEKVINAMRNDERFLEDMKALSGGGLEFPIPCDRLIRYIEELVGVDLSNARCKARGKFMYKPSFDLWIAGQLAYAIDLYGYLGAAGYAGFSGSIAGAQELGLLTIVYINNQLDTVMMNYNYNDNSHVAFNAGFVVWTSETGGVSVDITTDHQFSNGQYDWSPAFHAVYQF